MAPTVEVDADQLRRAADRMEELHLGVSAILSTLRSSSSTKGAPWGDDGYGAEFADGPEGYLAARRAVFRATRNMAGTFGSYRRGQLDAARLLQTQERLSAGQFR